MHIQTRATEAEIWVDFVKEGQARSYITLSETEEAYTVHMLQRFVLDSELTNTTLALGYLESQTESNAKNYRRLWYTADAGLLMAGLFPERARKKNVPVSYLRGMSQVCFLGLAELCDRIKLPLEAKEFREIAVGVERVAYVLYCTRRKNSTVHEMLQLPTRNSFH